MSAGEQNQRDRKLPNLQRRQHLIAFLRTGPPGSFYLAPAPPSLAGQFRLVPRDHYLKAQHPHPAAPSGEGANTHDAFSKK